MDEVLVDTSVVIDLPSLLADDVLPDALYVSAITMAELATGPALARDVLTRARRERLLMEAQRTFPQPLAFDGGCIAAYRVVADLTVADGRKPGRRLADLLIAGTALAHGLPLATRNPSDVLHLHPTVEVLAV